MLPGFKPLKLYRGDTFAFRMNLYSGKDPQTQELIKYPITTQTFIAQIKEKGKSAVVATFECEAEDGPNGVLLIVLQSPEAYNLKSGKKYEYDVQMNHNGNISTILRGPIAVLGDTSS